MAKLARTLVVLMGAISLAFAMGLWLGTATIMPKIGLAATDLAGGLVGHATVRADIAALFGGMGVALILAGLRQSRHWANVTLLFTSFAIAGRFASLLLEGQSTEVWPPIIVEAAIIAILLWYRSGLKRM